MPDAAQFVPLVCIIAVLSVVHSLFGLGLLVFGTPTLLLLGIPFDVTLALLLPPSVAINLIQVVQGRREIGGRLAIVVPAITIPCIGIGLYVALSGWVALDFRLIVGLLMLGTACMRFSATAHAWMYSFLQRHLYAYLVAMGLCHGLSNMGGGMLAVLWSTVKKDKSAVRSNIAYNYLLFAGGKLVLLAFLRPALFGPQQLALMAVAAAVYWLIGDRVFAAMKSAAFTGWITVLMLAYGTLLLTEPVKAWWGFLVSAAAAMSP